MNLKAFSKSFDEHLCLSLHNSLRDRPDVPGEIFQRHQEGSGARGSMKSQGAGAPPSVGTWKILSFLPQAVRARRLPAWPGKPRARIGYALLDREEKTFSMSVPNGPVEKPRGHKQNPVGTEQNKSLVRAGFIQKQKPSA